MSSRELSHRRLTLDRGARLGPYEVDSAIGAGGMGEVYRAVDTRLERQVAVKVLPERFATDDLALARFQREAKAVASLSHPNILSIFDFGSDSGVLYTVTELLEGESLREKIDRGRIPWRDAVEIAASVGDGLAAAHAKGIVHRDLKPDNIFLTADGRVKILDFGLVHIEPRGDGALDKTTPRETMPGTLVGTISYLAPEVLRESPASARSDIFALGCILLEMITGEESFGRPTAADTISAILHDDPLRSVPPDVPRELQQLIAACLAKQPAERLDSARDLAYGLRSLLAQDDSRAVPAGRRRTVLGGVTLALAAIAILASLVYRNHVSSLAAPQIDSIAVLPFDNLTNDRDADFLSFGIAEGLTNSLSHVPSLRVIPASTVLSSRAKASGPVEIGKLLGVRGVVAGRVRKRGDLLLISTELIDVKNGSQIWGDSYQTKIADLMNVDEQTTQAIAVKLRMTLDSVGPNIQKHATENGAAYELYLRGRYQWNKRSIEALRLAIDDFERAIEKDPAYAPAYAGVADCYSLLADRGAMENSIAFPRAKAAARKAVLLDDSLAEAHTSLALIAQDYEWDWNTAEVEYRSAIERNPNYATAHQWYAIFLAEMHRYDEAIREIRIAASLDPLSLPIAKTMGDIYYWAHRTGDAIEAYDATVDLDPNFPTVYDARAEALISVGRNSEAIRDLQRSFDLAGDHEMAQTLRDAYLAGGFDEVHRRRAALLERRAAGTNAPTEIAENYAALGNAREAMRWLRVALEQHTPTLLYASVDPDYDRLRSNAEFRALLAGIGLPQDK